MKGPQGKDATFPPSPVSGDINNSHKVTGHLGWNILADQWHAKSHTTNSVSWKRLIPLPCGGLSPVSSSDLSDPKPLVFERSEFRPRDRSARLR